MGDSDNPPPTFAPVNVRAGGVTLESIAIIGTTAEFPDVRATKQAAEGITSSSASGGKLSSALVDAVIASLKAQVP